MANTDVEFKNRAQRRGARKETKGLDRKQLKQQDEFVQTGQSVLGKLNNYSKQLAIGVGVLVIFVISGSLWSDKQAEKAAEARDALFLASQDLEAERKALADAIDKNKKTPAKKDKNAPPAPPTDVAMTYKKLDVPASYPKTIASYTKVAEEHAGTRAAFEATLQVGNLFFNHGSSEQAVTWFEKAIDQAPSSIDEAGARLALGASLLNTNQFANARAQFERALALGDSPLKGELLIALAQTYELEKNKDEASKTYNRVIDELSGTAYEELAKVKKQELSS